MVVPIPPPGPVTSRKSAAQTQHARMLSAVMQVSADIGYARTTVAAVIARAGVSRRAFYEQFDNVEDCFLTAYDAGADRLYAELTAVISAHEANGEWADCLRELVRTYFESFAQQPEFGLAALVEVLAAGAEARSRYQHNTVRFENLIAAYLTRTGDLGRGSGVSDWLVGLLVGGLSRHVLVELLSDGGENLVAQAGPLAEALVTMVRDSAA